ncbi:MAG: PAS domain-containing protein [Pseudomonadota bacterium]|nr:PAS domain-containing protein [Pseudomonadota bacterium]
MIEAVRWPMPGFEGVPEPGPEARLFLAGWLAARQGGLVPAKDSFDPGYMPRLLGHVWLYARDPETGVYSNRLAGEAVNRAWGFSLRGRTTSEIFPASEHDLIVGIWDRILDTPLIHYGRRERLDGTSLYMAERMVTPLADADGRPRYVLGLTLYELGIDSDAAAPRVNMNAWHVPCAALDGDASTRPDLDIRVPDDPDRSS